MSRKQILKNIKKSTKNNKIIRQSDMFYKFVTTIAAVLLTLVLCYLIIGVFMTKEINVKKDSKKDTKDSTSVTIDNSVITGGQIFDQKDESYYVVIYDFESKVLNISNLVSSYSSKENALPIYKVDSSKKFNNRYIVKKDSNTNPSSYEDLRILSPTIMKIENGKVTSYVEGEDSIKEILKK